MRGASLLQLQWTHAAREDLREALEWLDRQSVESAMAFEERLFEALDSARAFSKMGRLATGIDESRFPGDEIRELLVGAYRVGYAARAKAIVVVYVAHARRKSPR